MSGGGQLGRPLPLGPVVRPVMTAGTAQAFSFRVPPQQRQSVTRILLGRHRLHGRSRRIEARCLGEPMDQRFRLVSGKPGHAQIQPTPEPDVLQKRLFQEFEPQLLAGCSQDRRSGRLPAAELVHDMTGRATEPVDPPVEVVDGRGTDVGELFLTAEKVSNRRPLFSGHSIPGKGGSGVFGQTPRIKGKRGDRGEKIGDSSRFPVLQPVAGETPPGPDQLLSAGRMAARYGLSRRLRSRTGQVGGNLQRLRVIQVQRRHTAPRMVAGGVLQVAGQTGDGQLRPDAIQGITFRGVACGATQRGVEVAAAAGVHVRPVRFSNRQAGDRPRSEKRRYVPGLLLVQQRRHSRFRSDRGRIKQPAVKPNRVQPGGGGQVGSASAIQGFRPTNVTIDASQVLDQVSAPFDPVLVRTGRAPRFMEQDPGRDRLQRKMLRFPAQPEPGRPRKTPISKPNAMSAGAQDHGFVADPLTADLQPAPDLESIAARLQNRKEALPLGLETGVQGGVKGLSFLQVEIGSRSHQVDPMPSVFVAGGQPRPEFPLPEVRRSRGRTRLTSRTAGTHDGHDEQNEKAVKPEST